MVIEILVVLVVLITLMAFGDTTLDTKGHFSGVDHHYVLLTFNLENYNHYDIAITSFTLGETEGNSLNMSTFSLWRKESEISALDTVSGVNGWTQMGYSLTVAAPASGVAFDITHDNIIAGDSQIGMAISSTSVKFGAAASYLDSVTVRGVGIKFGGQAGWGTHIGNTVSVDGRGFYGTISFKPVPLGTPTKAPVLLRTARYDQSTRRLQATSTPTGQPSGGPSRRPSSKPSRQPSNQPSSRPSRRPSAQPSCQPSRQPTSQPSRQPSRQPTSKPTGQPTMQPSRQPSGQPTRSPTQQPSGQPTRSPTQQPTGQPSRKPTGQPTRKPSGQPSRHPSSHPSSQPTAQPTMPSGQPSRRPTRQPTSQPSRNPSCQPTCRPSMRPSSQPSSRPSRQPSSRPSEVPSMQPTSKPSMQPSSQPSRQPSGQPVSQPTGQPSSRPSMKPSQQPSSLPTRQPSGQPTSRPSLQPSSQPSGQPSCQPTSRPSNQPTSQPSGHPSSQPSSLPTSQPSGQPTSQPSGQPTGMPSGQPSGQPSSDPSSQPTSQPSCQPTGQPTSDPTGQPTSDPSSQPSAQPTMPPSGQPSGVPSSQPSMQPTGVPSRQPSTQPTSGPTSVPSSAPTQTLPYAEIRTMEAVTNRTTATVMLYVAAEVAMVYCGAFEGNYSLTSVRDIASQGFVGICTHLHAVVELTGLAPLTNYSLFCYTINQWGSVMPTVVAATHQLAIRTKCCKPITASIDQPFLSYNARVVNALTITVVNAPSESIILSVTVSGLYDAITVSPSSFSVTSASETSRSLAITSCTTVGDFTLAVSVSGASSFEYSSITYLYGKTFTVMDPTSDSLPPAPLVQSAVINTQDYGSFDITFSAATNRGIVDGSSSSALADVVSCNSLLSFTGATSAMCVWRGDAVIRVFPLVGTALSVGSTITVLGETLRAKCLVLTSSTTNGCEFYGTVDETSIPLSLPAPSTKPVVFLAVPSVIGSCSDLVLDLTSSVGQGWQAWSIVNISTKATKDTVMSVRSSSSSSSGSVSLSAINAFFHGTYDLAQATPLPHSLLTAGATFTFTAVLCNFAGVCGSAMQSVTVSSDPSTPLVGVWGAPFKTITRSQAIRLQAHVAIDGCTSTSSSASSNNYVTSWSMSANSYGASIPSSVSRNALVFALNPYSLMANTIYQVSFTAQNSETTSMASTSIRVAVVTGAVVPVVTGGVFRSVTVGRASVFDASGSYDEDTYSATSSRNAVGLVFVWSCLQIASSSSSDGSVGCTQTTGTCSTSNVASTVASVFTPVPSTAATNTSWELDVTISKGVRSVQSSTIEVTVTPTHTAAVTIVSSGINLQTSRLTIRAVVNTSMPSAWFGSAPGCVASWVANDANVQAAMSLNSLTPISQVVPWNQVQSVYLALPSTVLSTASGLVLTLQCNNNPLNYAGVTVNINRPPQMGTLTVSPSTGIELSTEFTYFASNWRDIDGNLPLSYSFGSVYSLQSSSSSLLTLCAPSESSFCESVLLPAPPSISSNNSVSCFGNVMDSLGAGSLSYVSVTVTRLELDALISKVQTQISSLLGNSDVMFVKQTLQTSTGAINGRVDCDMAPNCTLFHRSACAKTPNTCGDCLDGFVGDVGDENSICVSVAVYSRELQLLGAACSNDTYCGEWSVCSNLTTSSTESSSSSVCVGIPKPCPGECSGVGTCSYFQQQQSVDASVCRIGFDSSCTAMCLCDSEYGGLACENNATDVGSLGTVRSQALVSLGAVVGQDQADYNNVASWVSILSQVASSQSQSQLNADALVAIPTVTAAILQQLSESSVSGEAADGLLGALDTAVLSAVAASSSPGSSGLNMNITSYVGQVLEVVRNYGAVSSSAIVPGEPSRSQIGSTFRLSSSAYTSSSISGSGNITIQSPTSVIEQLSATVQGGVVFAPSQLGSDAAVLRVSAVVTSGASFGNQSTTRLESDVYSLQMYTEESGSITTGNDDGNGGDDVTVSTSSSASMNVAVFTIPRIYSVNTSTDVVADHWDNETFTTRCRAGTRSVHTHTCRFTDYVITHNCSYGYNMTLKSSCPAVHHHASCSTTFSSLGSTTAISQQAVCVTVNSTATHVTCACNISSASRRRLSSSSTVKKLEQSGAASVSVYVAGEFAGTLASAESFNSLADLQRVLIVICIFSVLWCVGLVTICSCTFYRESNKQTENKLRARINYNKQRLVTAAADSPEKMRYYLTDYITEVFPAAFRKTENVLNRIRDEVYSHHRYALILFSARGEVNDKRRLLTGVQLLTIQTMLIFLLAVLYDLQTPTNDGTCPSHSNELDCLQRKSYFDPHQTYCLWKPQLDDHGNQSFSCEYANVSMSAFTMLYISVLVSTCTALVNYPLDSLFELLTAPTADSLKLQQQRQSQPNALVRVGRRMSETARRVSVELNKSVVSAVAKIRARSQSMVGQATRNVPDKVMAAHGIVVGMAPYLQSKADEILSASELLALERRRMQYDATTGRRRAHSRAEDGKDEGSDEEDDEQDEDEESNDSDDGKNHSKPQRQASVSSPATTTNSMVVAAGSVAARATSDTASANNFAEKEQASATKIEARRRFECLKREIEWQRRYVPSRDLDSYDSAWGIDPTGEFHRQTLFGGALSSIPGLRSAGVMDSGRVIKQEVSTVLKLSNAKTEKLSLATDAHAGLEILHLFVLDVLGRDTPAARIFKSKSDEDFRHTEVVSRRAKGLAWFALILINGFFIYFTMLRGAQRGLVWQRSFLFGCMVQCIVEILLNETVECIWVNLMVPSLANEEVSEVAGKLKEVVNNLCPVNERQKGRRTGVFGSSAAGADKESQLKVLLNAPKYLFVSTNVANNFPKLIESIIVRSYQTYYPGELAKKWRLGSTLSRLAGGLRSLGGPRTQRTFRLIAVMVSMLQFIGAAPFVVQRTIIRLVQPWILSSIYYVGTCVERYPLYAGSVIGGLVLLLCVYMARYYYALKRQEELDSIDAEIESEVAQEELDEYNNKVNHHGATGMGGIVVFGDGEENNRSGDHDHDQNEDDDGYVESDLSARSRKQHQKKHIRMTGVASDHPSEGSSLSELENRMAIIVGQIARNDESLESMNDLSVENRIRGYSEVSVVSVDDDQHHHQQGVGNYGDASWSDDDNAGVVEGERQFDREQYQQQQEQGHHQQNDAVSSTTVTSSSSGLPQSSSTSSSSTPELQSSAGSHHEEKSSSESESNEGDDAYQYAG